MSHRWILVIVLAVVIAAVVFLGADTARAAERIMGDELVPPPKPEPLFKPLPPGQEKVATIQTSTGPVTLVQKWDTSALNELPTKKVAPVVKLAQLKPIVGLKPL
jgi:hypothetical protein